VQILFSSHLHPSWLIFLVDDQDEIRKLQAKVLAEIFEERLEDIRRQFPQLDIERDDDDDGKCHFVWPIKYTVKSVPSIADKPLLLPFPFQ
jgi:hypothetical protein